jgi:hypothetical protein
MNILMLGRWLPPPRQPVKATREYQFARQLARAHRLTLAFVNDSPDAAGPISALRTEFGDLEFASVPRAWRSVAGAISLATGESCTLSYFRSEALRTRLADRLRRAAYDAVLVTSSSMIQYALEVDRAIPLVADFGSVESEWWAAQSRRSAFPSGRFLRTEAVRLRSVEAAAAKSAAHCIVATSEAARIVKGLSASGPVTLIPNGLDVEFFGATPRASTRPTVVLTAVSGSGDEVADVTAFFRQVAPVVRARLPRVQFIVSIRDPLGAPRALAAVREAEIAGPTTDLRTLFHSHAIAAAPGGGKIDLRSSVLEPMAAGVPVVAGAYVRDELGVKATEALQVSESAVDFGLRIIQLLEDATLRAELGARGRAYVSAHHAWSVLTPKLSEIVEGLAKPEWARERLTPAAVDPRAPVQGGDQ